MVDFLGCFDPVYVIFSIKLNDFRGDVTDTRAKKKHCCPTGRARDARQPGALGDAARRSRPESAPPGDRRNSGRQRSAGMSHLLFTFPLVFFF